MASRKVSAVAGALLLVVSSARAIPISGLNQDSLSARDEIAELVVVDSGLGLDKGDPVLDFGGDFDGGTQSPDANPDANDDAPGEWLPVDEAFAGPHEPERDFVGEYAGDAGAVYRTMVRMETAPVPEPKTMLIAGVALIVLSLVGPKRRNP